MGAIDIIIGHVLKSMEHLVIGYGAALAIGLAFGIYLYQVRRNVLIMGFDAIRGVPALALFPVFIYTVGNGVMAKSLIIFWTAFPTFALGVATALHSCGREVIEAAQLDGASSRRAMFTVAVPASASAIVLAARSAAGAGLIGLIAAEMLGASSGLGFYIMSSSQMFKFVDMAVGILLIALLGSLINLAFSKYYERLES